jgi:type IV pilus assembly protein PilC
VSRRINWRKPLARLTRTKPTEIILFYRQLALLLNSGIDIITALELLQGQITNRRLTMALGEVISELRGGSQLSVAMSKHPELFPEASCRLLNIGEESGNFEATLGHLADYMEKEANAAKGLKGALMYPIIAAVITVVVVAVLLVFVLPAFGDLYGSLDAELPTMAKVMISAGELFKSIGVWVVLVAILLVGVAVVYFRTTEGRYRWDKTVLRLPLIGRINHLKELARSCRSIALLFHAGLPVTEIIHLTAMASNNRVITSALQTVEKDMVKGEGLSRPMGKNRFFLPLMVQMVRIGEETGNLDSNLEAVAQNYEVEADDKTRSMTNLIQPLLTIVIGGVIGLVALTLASAMYSIYGQEI